MCGIETALMTDKCHLLVINGPYGPESERDLYLVGTPGVSWHLRCWTSC